MHPIHKTQSNDKFFNTCIFFQMLYIKKFYSVIQVKNFTSSLFTYFSSVSSVNAKIYFAKLLNLELEPRSTLKENGFSGQILIKLTL